MQQNEAQSLDLTLSGDRMPDTSRPPPMVPGTSSDDFSQNGVSFDHQQEQNMLRNFIQSYRQQQSQIQFQLEWFNQLYTVESTRASNENRFIQRAEDLISTANSLLAYNYSGRCSNCGYFRAHSNAYNKHKTCICNLFGARAICCLDGYATLLELIPSLGFVASQPRFFCWEIDSVASQGNEAVIKRTPEENRTFINTCIEIRRKLVSALVENQNVRYTISTED